MSVKLQKTSFDCLQQLFLLDQNYLRFLPCKTFKST